MNEERIAMYTGNNDDSIIVNTTDESISIWDQVESMMASEMTVGEVDALVHEIERLRALITELINAAADGGVMYQGITQRWWDAKEALRKAVGR